MKPFEEILEKYKDITRWPEYPELIHQDYLNANYEYSIQLIDRFIELLNEYDGSITYTEIADQIKKEILN